MWAVMYCGVWALRSGSISRRAGEREGGDDLVGIGSGGGGRVGGGGDCALAGLGRLVCCAALMLLMLGGGP